MGVSGDFVESVRIQRFGCVRDTTIELTRLHALIGPNDSGKSTVLSALRMVSEPPVDNDFEFVPDPRAEVDTAVTLVKGTSELAYRLADHGWVYKADNPMAMPLIGAQLVRWQPDAIRRPSALISEDDPFYLDTKGGGLPAIYEALLSRDRVAFGTIEEGVRRHFPTVKNLWLPTSADKKKEIGAILVDGTKVRGTEMSEGLLYWLAFAILPFVDDTSLILVEEPENGLHPSRIAEVMKVLRTVSANTQVILATHSPLVINEMHPEEVTILTRTAAEGTRATRIDRTSHFQSREKVYALGELWLSFADGNSEEALVPAG